MNIGVQQHSASLLTYANVARSGSGLESRDTLQSRALPPVLQSAESAGLKQQDATSVTQPFSRQSQSPSEPQANEGQTASLSEEEIQQLTELAKRDAEVRAHERAHMSAGGKYAGTMALKYQRGPDGVSYAIGGEVSIDTSKVANDPEATLQKAEAILRAALAPAEPSGQDLSVAAQAMQMVGEARIEIARAAREEKLAEEEALKAEEASAAEDQALTTPADEEPASPSIDEQSVKDDELAAQRDAFAQQSRQLNRLISQIITTQSSVDPGVFLNRLV